MEDILNLSFEDLNLIDQIKIAEKNSRRILLKKDLSYQELCLISEQCADSSNLLITNRFKRFYPFHTLASHVLGYLSKQDERECTVGLYGIEKVFQDELKGETGCILSVINSKGQKMAQKELRDPKAGNDLQLTLDWQLQAIAEKMFEPEQSGAFILMDPENGAVRVLVSYPNFDPNAFLETITQQDWDEKLSYNNPLLNRVTSSVYPPASIFKLVTFAQGLEEGIVKPDSVEYFCKGYTEFCGRKYHCINRKGHGKLDAKMALAYSCNIPCFQIALKAHINQLAEYAFRFGLGRHTGFLLPERIGLVPTYEWKVATKHESWWKGETLSVSIGQSYTLVSPIQIARMIAAICTGYLVRPRLLEQEQIDKEPLQISSSTLEFLREAMREVASVGSARLLSRLKDFEIYAKTGTAQTSSLEREVVSKRQIEHAWLASYFSYKGEKPLVMIVLLENVGSSTYARRMVGKFLRFYKKLKEGKNLEAILQETSTTNTACGQIVDTAQNFDHNV